VTLGKSEVVILTEIREVIPQIIGYERQARSTLTRESRQALHDRVSRAFGTLQNATMMTSEETMDLLSSVRLGVNLGLLEEKKITIPTAVNELSCNAAGPSAKADGHAAGRRGTEFRAGPLPAHAPARNGANLN